LHVGLEGTDTLWTDLAQGLKQATH
jgi:cystathionine beta-lyase/cystathionine gamma-synthase